MRMAVLDEGFCSMKLVVNSCVPFALHTYCVHIDLGIHKHQSMRLNTQKHPSICSFPEIPI